MKQVSKFGSFFMFPITVLFAHLAAWKVLNLYLLFPNLDIPFHYVGGLSIAYTSAQILAYLEQTQIATGLNKVIFLVFIFTLTATATVFWEFVEFSIDQILNTNIQISLANTMQDQFMGVLGGATCVLIYFKRIEKTTGSRTPS